jgi:hypothetical protein
MKSPESGSAIPIHSSHSATVPVIRIASSSVASTRAPIREWVRSQGSNGSPSGRTHSA